MPEAKIAKYEELTATQEKQKRRSTVSNRPGPSKTDKWIWVGVALICIASIALIVITYKAPKIDALSISQES